MLTSQIGNGSLDVGCGDDREDPALAFLRRQADQRDLPRVGHLAEDGPEGDPFRGHRLSVKAVKLNESGAYPTCSTQSAGVKDEIEVCVEDILQSARKRLS